MNEVKGYAMISPKATTFTSTNKLEEFTKQPVRIHDINERGDVLVLNPEATALASVDACDVLSHFRCDVSGEFLLPPGLDILNQFAYATKLQMRKGGYNQTLRAMIVLNSLRKGKYDDAFIFQKENEEKNNI